MTRRNFLALAAPAAARAAVPARLSVPLNRVVDGGARIPPARLQHFWPQLWSEAARDFAQGGISFAIADTAGKVRHSAAGRPIFEGLERAKINLVVTDTIPIFWDGGRALAGVSTIHEGYHISMIALRYAHRNQVAFLSLNTCLHELLHVLMQDIFLPPPKWYQVGEKEARVDYYATRLWLFHDGTEVRRSGEAYLRRLGAQAR